MVFTLSQVWFSGQELIFFFAWISPFQFEFVGVVHQPVENGVGQGRVLHGVVPCLDRQLAGDDGCFSVIAVLDDFQKLFLVIPGKGRNEQIVQYQDLALGERRHELCGNVRRAWRRRVPGGAWQSLVEGGMPVPACFLSQGAGEIALAGAGGSGDKNVVATRHPLILGK